MGKTTYTIATLNDVVIAIVPDGGDIYAAVADEAERAGIEIDFDDLDVIEGVTLVDEEKEGDEVVFRAGPHTGYLMDEEGRWWSMAVIRKATPVLTAAAFDAARRFFRLAEVAARHGGFWVSAGGGTANVVAGVIARATGVSFEEAQRLLDEAGKEWAARAILEDVGPELADHIRMGWYEVLSVLASSGERFDARTIARAACRH